MAKKVTESEILEEMSATGGDDYFAIEARLQARANQADRDAKRLEMPAEADTETWTTEPQEALVIERMRTYGITHDEAYSELKAELVEDAKRLAVFAPAAAAEISESLQAAESARMQAEEKLADHQAALGAITNGILALGNLRKKIRVLRTLALDNDVSKNLAAQALHYFIDRKISGETTANTSGFRTIIEDLTFRTVLNPHLQDHISPLEKEAQELIASIREAAKAKKIDLLKALQLLSGERGHRRGIAIDSDSNLYTGLVEK